MTNRSGSTTFPKGSLKSGEEPRDGALREIAEETGLMDVEIHGELGVITREGYTAENTETPSVVKRIRVFLCSTRENVLEPQAADVAEARWADPEEAIRLLSYEAEAEFLREHRSEIKRR